MDELKEKRKIIDIIDESIIRFISQRMQVVQEIVEIKKKSKIPVVDNKRKELMLEAREQLAEKLGLDKQLIRRIYESIHEYSVQVQEEKLKDKIEQKNNKNFEK